MVKLDINFNGLELKNPILTASGTFGYGKEYEDFIDIDELGAIIVKGTTLNERQGNPYPRMCETSNGMINAVGLQNKGVNYFCNNIYPIIKHYKTNIIVNVSGSTNEEYIKVAEILNTYESIKAIELNISCPNVKEGGMSFGTDENTASKLVKQVRNVYNKHLMVKLTPNVTDIVSIAQAVEDAGADSVSLVNTFLAMAIDIQTKKPKLSTITGGLSGPAIKPIALRMVWQTAKKVKIPVCGIGGIMTAEDAIEFLLAGASAVQIGTANFIQPDVSMKILDGIKQYCSENKINNISEIIGALR